MKLCHGQQEKTTGTNEATSKNTAAKGRIGHHSDAKLAARLQESVVLDIETEWRIFDLIGGYGVDCVCSAESVRGAF